MLLGILSDRARVCVCVYTYVPCPQARHEHRQSGNPTGLPENGFHDAANRCQRRVINGRKGNLAAGLMPSWLGSCQTLQAGGKWRRVEEKGSTRGWRQIKSSQSVAAKSIQQDSVVSGSRGEMCAKLLRNTSARITSRGARLHTGMLHSKWDDAERNKKDTRSYYVGGRGGGQFVGGAWV